jgi:hypothetical protein
MLMAAWVVLGEFVVASGDTAEAFELVEAAFNDVAAPTRRYLPRRPGTGANRHPCHRHRCDQPITSTSLPRT